MIETPKATEKTIVERNNDRFITVHNAEHDVLDFIRAQVFWQYPHHVAKHRNAPTHVYGRISPLFDLEKVVAWLEALTVDDIPDDFEYPDVDDYGATFEPDYPILVELLPVDDDFNPDVSMYDADKSAFDAAIAAGALDELLEDDSEATDVSK